MHEGPASDPLIAQFFKNKILSPTHYVPNLKPLSTLKLLNHLTAFYGSQVALNIENVDNPDTRPLIDKLGGLPKRIFAAAAALIQNIAARTQQELVNIAIAAVD